MLRRKVGDDLFWEGIRKYYKEYALKNASTNDLKKVFEQISGQNLEQFFEQWLEKPGHPILNTSYVQNDNIIMIKIQQTQKDFPLFSFPLEIEVVYNNRSSEKIRIRVTQQNEVFSVKIKSLVSKIIIDPDIWLLYETAE
jgi:aminopeptidase N